MPLSLRDEDGCIVVVDDGNEPFNLHLKETKHFRGLFRLWYVGLLQWNVSLR